LVKTLDHTGFKAAVEYLCEIDPILGEVTNQYGMPKLLDRPSGFPTLVYTILEQQVSLASAKSTYSKLTKRIPDLSPELLLTLSSSEMLEIGFSRQKARYSRLLAEAVIQGKLDMDALSSQSDQTVFSKLTALTGVGPWTANIYLLSALKRPNIWPAGDLALQVAVQELYKLSRRPQNDEIESFGDRWTPYRAVAARILWQYYVSRDKMKN